MTNEKDFMKKILKDLFDYQTRLVFADWLEDRNDPRALAWRALGVYRIVPCRMYLGCFGLWNLKRYPAYYRPGRGPGSPYSTNADGGGAPYAMAMVPSEWWLSSCGSAEDPAYVPHRTAHDAFKWLVRGFQKLPIERQRRTAETFEDDYPPVIEEPKRSRSRKGAT